uniref:Uncharacterized protein n=1 Tax=mine drainage metagenome TaxID=410659 RepID=E6PRB6_9ZZZZ
MTPASHPIVFEGLRVQPPGDQRIAWADENKQTRAVSNPLRAIANPLHRLPFASMAVVEAPPLFLPSGRTSR